MFAEHRNLPFCIYRSTDGAAVVLDPDESVHLIKVRRAGVGDNAVLIGRSAGPLLARVTRADPKACELEIIEHLALPELSRPRIELALAVTKGSALDDAIEDCVPLGVDGLSPIISERSGQPAGVLAKKQQRRRKLVEQAAKQARLPLVPVLEEPTPLAAYLDGLSAAAAGELRLICTAVADSAPLRVVLRTDEVPVTIRALVGPEGGFGDAEASRAEASGFTPVSLGFGVLKARLAPAVLLAAINYEYEGKQG